MCNFGDTDICNKCVSELMEDTLASMNKDKKESVTMNNEQILKEVDKLVKECIPAMIKAELEKFIPSFANHIAHDINANNKNVVNPLKRKVASLKEAVVDLEEEVFPDECD